MTPITFLWTLWLLGGAIARLKGDYFSRGMAIVFLAGLPGLIVLLFSARSNVGHGDERDEHEWPRFGALAFYVNLLIVIALGIGIDR